MSRINYIEGDLFAAINDHKSTVIIPHVCNNQGAWGAGFVLPLAKAYPNTRDYYLKWFKTRRSDIAPVEITKEYGMDDCTTHTGTFAIGQVQLIMVRPDVAVANMVAQTLGGKRPLSYKYLGRCMERVSSFCKGMEFIGKTPRIVCPMFGSGLAGGNWNFIEQLIEDHWGFMDIDVHYLPQFIPDNWTLPENGVHEFEERL